LEVDSPVDEIKAEISKTEARLASLKTNLAEASTKKLPRELKYWKEKYADLAKSEKEYPGRREKWIARVAKILKMDPAELRKILEAE
jgi:hypothetical protein